MPGGLGFNSLKLPRMVLNPFRDRVQFVVERLLLSGTIARLAVAAAAIGLVAVGMGLLGFLVATDTLQASRNPAEAVWWAFLRLSDPGYLGDDEGLGLQAVSAKAPRVVLELLDELNVALIDPERCEYLLSPQVLSHMLAQVALRREMNAIYEELFNSGETEITFRNPMRYGTTPGQKLTFAELEVMARRHNEVALGYLKACERATATGRGVHLNPDRAESRVVAAGDQFIVLRN